MKIETGLSEGQVLQRQGKKGAKGATVQIRGTCETTGPVMAAISKRSSGLAGWKKVAVGKAANGLFTATLKGTPTGGPYRLELQVGKEKLRINSFYVGDVWLLAGQSNMEGIGNMTDPAKPHPLIRAFSMRREWCLAEDPLHILRESPDSCHNDGPPLTLAEAQQFRRRVRKGVGVGIFFAREMLKRSGVPQGLICAAHGGTSMTQWSPDRKDDGGSSLYGSMLLSVRATGQPVAGMLWYQGESDANDTDKLVYTERMQKLVAATRHDLKQPSLPWLVVQIARFTTDATNGAAWNDIQEQERLLPDKIKNLETVAAIDLPLDDGIHIGALGFVRLGVRLARMADRLVYGNIREPKPPQLREIRLNHSTNTSAGNMGPSIDVVFDHAVGGLQAKGEPLGFALITAEGSVWPCWFKTTLHHNTARLHLDRLPPDGTKLQYGHGLTPICNITDGRDLSLPVFGPQPLTTQKAYLPYVTTWRVTDIVAPPSMPLAKLPCPDFNTIAAQTKTYPDGFINEHAAWLKKSGHAYFSAQIELPEPMKLQFLMSYDGHFRLWVDGESAFADLEGLHIRSPDMSGKVMRLQAGKHRLTIAMDINEGVAWGFVLRLVRLDVGKAQIKADNFRRPVYSA